MKKLLGIIILSLFCFTISYAQIIKLTKCYVNSMDDRNNPSSNWNYNNKTWNENSFNSFMKQYGLTISSIIVNTETSGISTLLPVVLFTQYIGSGKPGGFGLRPVYISFS